MRSAVHNRAVCQLVLLLSGSILLASCSSVDGGSTKDPHSVESSASPLLTGSTVRDAEKIHNISIESVDLGSQLIDSVEEDRNIDGRAQWRIIAYCPGLSWGTARAGVVRNVEYGEVVDSLPTGTSIAENTLVGLLDCT